MPISDETIDNFASLFSPYYLQNYGVQYDYNSHSWYYRHRNMCFYLVKCHLTGKFYIGVPGTWYVHHAYIDIDNPLNTPPELVLKSLNMNDSEHYKMSSPGYSKEGKIHIIYKPRYKFNDITRKLHYSLMNPRIKNTGSEPFPQGNRICRVPLGHDQYILDENGNPLDLSPEEFMYWIDKLDYYETSEKITYQTSMLFELYPDTSDPIISTITIDAARTLEKHGLQRTGSRHDACLTLGIYYYRYREYPPEKAIRKLKIWLRKGHHGYSDNINKHRWWFVDKEIEEIVNWVYENYTGFYYPDSIHNFKTGLIPPELVKGAVEPYRGDWINIKRTISLFRHCYMRRFFPWIHIPRSIWDKIASRGNYIDYQNDLSKKGIMTDKRNDYSPGNYPKSFQIALPKSFGSPITDDNRAVSDTSALLLRTYGTPRDVVNALQLKRTTAWELFNRS
ncbi:unnamed protein product [marine sediment metagenome]|uniref:Uncharacterized protein n=1 Tax=marine sediment metagenome TaxID=412755 RepID=X1K3Q8_9ZZZZ